MYLFLATLRDFHMWKQLEKAVQCRGLEVLALLETPIEWLVLGGGYNSTVRSFDPNELSILLEAVAVNLGQPAGMVTHLQTVVLAQLGPGPVVVAWLLLLWDHLQKLDGQDAARQVKLKERQCPGALSC